MADPRADQYCYSPQQDSTGETGSVKSYFSGSGHHLGTNLTDDTDERKSITLEVKGQNGQQLLISSREMPKTEDHTDLSEQVHGDKLPNQQLKQEIKLTQQLQQLRRLSLRISTLIKNELDKFPETKFDENTPIIQQESEERSVSLRMSVVSLPRSSAASQIGFETFHRSESAFHHEDPVMKKIINDLVYLQEKPSIWLLKLSDVKDIIMESTVSCSLFLALVAGLPYSGKSMLIRKFLRAAFFKPQDDPTGQELLFQHSERGLSSYGASILGHKPYDNLLWFTETCSSLHTFSCSSTILHDSLLQGQEVELTDRNVITGNASVDIFNDQILNEHITRVYTDIDRTLQKADLNPELKRIMSAGAVFVNILDTGFSKGILEFLTLISQYGRNRLSFVCMSIDDVEHLNEPPNLNYPRYKDIKSSVLRKGSRLSYIVRYAVAMHLGCPCSASTHPHLSFIITAKRALSEEEKDKAKVTLQKALAKEAARLKLSFLSSQNILILDSATKGLAELKSDFENAIKQQSPTRENIKMSWIFLRSALFFSDRVLISFDELELMAAELKIGSDELTRFLDTFTKFASILYLPKIKPLQKVVILQPVRFVNLLSRLFQPCDSQFNGVFTLEKIHELLPDEVVEVITSTLCSLGLATETTTDKVDYRPSQMQMVGNPVLFVPLARPGAFSSWQTSNESLFIVYDSNLTPPDFQGLIASELLSLKNVSLASTEEINVTKFLYGRQGDCMFSLSFQGTHVEVLIEHYRDIAEMFDRILQCCTRALTKLRNILKEFSYYLALQCLKPHGLTESEGIKKNREYERLPKQDLCYHCEKSKSPLRKKWNEAVHEMHYKTMRNNDCITPDKLFELATELGKFMDSDQVKNLAIQLAVQDDPELKLALSRYFSWQRVLFVLLAWERKVGRDQATKQRLSRALVQLGYVSNVLQD